MTATKNMFAGFALICLTVPCVIFQLLRNKLKNVLFISPFLFLILQECPDIYTFLLKTTKVCFLPPEVYRCYLNETKE